VRRKAAAAAGGRSAGASSPAPDAEPQGAALLSLDHLQEATRFLRFLQLQSAALLDTALLALQLNLRKQRWLLVWKAAKQAARAQPDSAELHEGSMRFILGVQAAWHSLQPVMQRLLQDEWTEERRSRAAAAGDEQQAQAAELQQADVAALNWQHLQRFGSSLEHRFAGQPPQRLLTASLPAMTSTACNTQRSSSSGRDERLVTTTEPQPSRRSVCSCSWSTTDSSVWPLPLPAVLPQSRVCCSSCPRETLPWSC
jgi:hypothetical protein